MENLTNKKVAILATNGFEESELTSPKAALEKAGATTEVISMESGSIKGWDNGNWGKEVDVDKLLSEANVKDYNALVLPGGVINPDILRRDKNAVSFVRDFFKAHKPVAAICHGPQMLIEADVVNDRKITSFPSIKKDLMNAGAKWVDEEVVVDEGLVTSRSPEDLEAFNAKVIEEVAEGKHEDQTV
ncbi:type 1 glutamine amidotransferase domain-containing protein [uncultured Roseivirga sp.]|uniref:type 1 glutamine amidotransferase domain-containing protein n=1 Tax=uncultured Roseivirga sp. TaxID=543088 RepID=UPI000D7AF99D|nr:type 1 glutamine amidotransferase domain-containing protein [uncultured Roseivirga sp.]PWL32069.1 MAG: protease [Roseivirga sp. XM-24bin3]